MELKTTTLDSRPARGDGTVEFFGCRAGRNEVFDNPYLGRIQMGDDGGRLTTGREDPGNQGWEIETLDGWIWNTFKEKKWQVPISNWPNFWRKKRSCSISRRRSRMCSKQKLRAVKETAPGGRAQTG